MLCTPRPVSARRTAAPLRRATGGRQGKERREIEGHSRMTEKRRLAPAAPAMSPSMTTRGRGQPAWWRRGSASEGYALAGVPLPLTRCSQPSGLGLASCIVLDKGLCGCFEAGGGSGFDNGLGAGGVSGFGDGLGFSAPEDTLKPYPRIYPHLWRLGTVSLGMMG